MPNWDVINVELILVPLEAQFYVDWPQKIPIHRFGAKIFITILTKVIKNIKIHDFRRTYLSKIRMG